MTGPPRSEAAPALLIPPDRYNILVEFAVRHLDFQRAELCSVLDLYGIELGGPDCLLLPLPSYDTYDQPHPRPFILLSFTAEYQKRLFRVKTPTTSNNQPSSSSQLFLIGSILSSQCTLVRSAVELWGMGRIQEDCVEQTKLWAHHSELGRSIFHDNAIPAKSWKTTVHTLGAKYTREEQDEMRVQFSFLNFQGPVQMKEPDNEFLLIREGELDAKGGVRYPRRDCDHNWIPENVTRSPLAVYFGRIVGEKGRQLKGRGGVQAYSLKKRSYLGPTSMDTELSFIMTNLGQVQNGSVVMDPFVGTGSILLSCGVRGAFCIGADIDLRVLRGRSTEENVVSNFRQANLPIPELVRSDNALYHRHYRRSTVPMYDAIITDPPYGIRAGARKTGSRLADPKPIQEEHRHDHIPQTKPYAVSDVMADLLDMAARTLLLNGRLVYVIPSFATDFSEEEDLPQHECLELLHSCYQPFTMELGRRIVTMKKIRDYDETRRDIYLSRVWKNGPESAEKCANIREKILEAAKKKPGYEEKAAVRKEKRKKHREAKKAAKALKMNKESAANEKK